MKKIVGLLVGVVIFLVLIFVVDGAIVNAITHAIPASGAQWLGIIKIASWFVVLWLTLGIAFIISFAVGMVIQAIFE